MLRSRTQCGSARALVAAGRGERPVLDAIARLRSCDGRLRLPRRANVAARDAPGHHRQTAPAGPVAHGFAHLQPVSRSQALSCFAAWAKSSPPSPPAGVLRSTAAQLTALNWAACSRPSSTSLKQAGVPVTLREYLTLMEAMEKDVASRRVEDFYYLSRAALVKDERNLDKFDRVFGHVFKGLDLVEDGTDRRNSGRVAQEADGKISHRGREEADRGARRPGKASGNAAPAACRTERPPPGRQEMDRHRAAPRRSAPTAIIPKACASARTRTATSAP